MKKYGWRERAHSNDTEKKNEDIINSDNENDRALHFTTSSSKASSNDLEHCSLNNDNLIYNLRRNKTTLNSFQSYLALLDWGRH